MKLSFRMEGGSTVNRKDFKKRRKVWGG